MNDIEYLKPPIWIMNVEQLYEHFMNEMSKEPKCQEVEAKPSLPRPQQIVADTTELFSVSNPNTRQLLDAKEKALVSLKSSLSLMRVLTRDLNVEEPPQIYKDIREAVKILENDVKL
jgi:hypothetical protein